jgi:hypothetical protein
MDARTWPISEIGAVDVQARDFTPYTGGMHDRLRLTLRNGDALLFNVKELDQAVAELQGLLATTQRCPEGNPAQHVESVESQGG